MRASMIQKPIYNWWIYTIYLHVYCCVVEDSNGGAFAKKSKKRSSSISHSVTTVIRTSVVVKEKSKDVDTVDRPILLTTVLGYGGIFVRSVCVWLNSCVERIYVQCTKL